MGTHPTFSRVHELRPVELGPQQSAVLSDHGPVQGGQRKGDAEVGLRNPFQLPGTRCCKYTFNTQLY